MLTFNFFAKGSGNLQNNNFGDTITPLYEGHILALCTYKAKYLPLMITQSQLSSAFVAICYDPNFSGTLFNFAKGIPSP